ncbi:unnamed protein product [Pleuronectes platessa]|uniref:Uncharacterized protein n=1 Tax=Pleuronectes platessa TaxID=8262 RepID=A0A9N7Y5A2_PLEPL|nr:unnamed protein product [Pleuronectes platessa]
MPNHLTSFYVKEQRFHSGLLVLSSFQSLLIYMLSGNAALLVNERPSEQSPESDELPTAAVALGPILGSQRLGLDGLEIEPDFYDVPADLSSDEEYLSGRRRTPHELLASRSSTTWARRSCRPSAGRRCTRPGERLKQSGERLKENIAKKAPNKETFRIKLKKERAVAEGRRAQRPTPRPRSRWRIHRRLLRRSLHRGGPGNQEEGPVEEAGATRDRIERQQEED